MEWPDRARRQAGVIARVQLREGGLSDTTIDRLVQRGELTRLAHRVFLVRGAPVTRDVGMWTAVISTGGVLTHASAAHLWGMDARPDRIHVTVTPRRRPLALPGVIVHRVRLPSSAMTHCDGLPVSDRGWTLLDHLGSIPRHRAAVLADRAVQQGWIVPRDIIARLRDYPWRHGNPVLRELVDGMVDAAAAESERIVHRLLRRAGIRGWRANHRVRIGTMTIIIDVAVLARRLAIEVDGWAFHSDVERFQRDRQRQNALVGAGWTVLRFTWADLTQRPDDVVRTLRHSCGVSAPRGGDETPQTGGYW